MTRKHRRVIRLSVVDQRRQEETHAGSLKGTAETGTPAPHEERSAPTQAPDPDSIADDKSRGDATVPPPKRTRNEKKKRAKERKQVRDVPLLPNVSPSDRPERWGDVSDDNDQRLLEDIPPHWSE